MPKLASADLDDLIAFAAGVFIAYKLRSGIAFTGEPLEDESGKGRRGPTRAERIAALKAGE
jgi:hypothetical protein